MGGYTYTRQEVFGEIDRPDFPERLPFHRQLWESPQVLALLEKSTADLNSIEHEFEPFFGNKKFDEFFSPFFAGPFNYISRTLLAEPDLNKMGKLLAYEDFLQPAERDEAFRPLRIFLDENLKLLKNTGGENYGLMRPKMKYWIESSWAGFFNNLPHEFYEVKNEIITRLINISVAVQKGHRGDCREMSDQLISLAETPESLRSVILTNHAAYNQNSSSFAWKNIRWIIWIIIILIKLAATGGC